MFKNIIFDWSGPIKDIVEPHSWVLGKMFEEMGMQQISLQEMRENWKQPYMRFWNRYNPGLTLDQEQKIYYEVVSRKDYPEARAYEGMVKLLKKLKSNNVSMVILSSDPTEILFSEIKKFGLENIFDEVVSDVHDKEEKIHELILRNKFNLKDTVFIGDSNHEVEVAKAAGIKSIAVTYGFTTEEKLKEINPDYLVHNIKELEKILLNDSK